MSELNMLVIAEAQTTLTSFIEGVKNFLLFVPKHWEFCLLHFLEFAIWGAWFVVLGNFLNARGFSRQSIGRIYATIPIGTIVSSLFIGAVADKYLNQEWLVGGAHLIGAVLLLLLTRITRPGVFFVVTLAYALVFAPTLSLVNSIVFAHDEDIFGGTAGANFPWIRVFGTIGWIVAGLSHAVILRKDQPVNERPLLLASALSLVLGIFALTVLPETPPAAAQAQTEATEAADQGTAAVSDAETSEEDGKMSWARQTGKLLLDNPVFFGVSFATAMAMGLYFAFIALYLEQRGVRPNLVGPVMTTGQMIEIFFMLTLSWFLGPEEEGFPYMKTVLLVGVAAWALRFGFFAIGRPMALVLVGVAIHGICFDFFFAAGMINSNQIAPPELTATAQQLYGFLVYGLGMYLGSEIAGWLNQRLSRSETTESGEVRTETNWRLFWAIPCGVITICAILFAFS